MEKKLKTLEEHNIIMHRIHNKEEKHLNGIACPLCGSELYDSNPWMVLTSNPPQKHVACTKCVWTGYATA